MKNEKEVLKADKKIRVLVHKGKNRSGRLIEETFPTEEEANSWIGIELTQMESDGLSYEVLGVWESDLVNYILEYRPEILTVMWSVSRSGMVRRVSAYVIKDNDIVNIEFLLEKMTHHKRDKDGNIVLHGCGMDMGFELVYNFSSNLFALIGFECIGEKCRSNDHSNGDRVRTPHLHSDGGYALRNRWLA